MKKWYSLIDKVYHLDNLYKAFKKVRSNKGKPGIDGVSVEAFDENLHEELPKLQHELKSGTYQPQPVKRVEIPKPDGSKRPLGIPTVRDRVVQQALLNIIQPIFEPDFHPSSYGYRPKRSCHHAVAKAQFFMREGKLSYAVDMDLSKCFDRLNHDRIIESVNCRISDGKVLDLIKRFLKSGVMQDNILHETNIGSPQGGVISPLLTNIYLDYFDQEMRRRGIRIVRYADDILIFAPTYRKAKLYLQIAINILEGELKLQVNQKKTHLASLAEGVAFLGFIIREKWLSIHPKKIRAFKDKVRKLTPRNHGKNLAQIIAELNKYLRGWINYFRIANCKGFLKKSMQWIRRRVRMKKMREWKRSRPLHKELRRRHYSGEFQNISMMRWRNSASPLVHYALPNKWFDEIGLINLERYETGTLSRLYGEVLQEPYTRPVRTVL